MDNRSRVTYDGDGHRVRKQVAGRLYWYGSNGEVLAETGADGSNPTEYIFFGGKRVARRDSSGNVSYYLSDSLGSTRVVTDSSGNILDDCDFLPYGYEKCATSGSGNHYLFTGLERDSESGLDHTLNRQYASNYGRWLSPDPGGTKVVKLEDPQTWNMYGYVRDNPLTLADPTGLQGGCTNQSTGCQAQEQVTTTYGTPTIYSNPDTKTVTIYQTNTVTTTDENGKSTSTEERVQVTVSTKSENPGGIRTGQWGGTSPGIATDEDAQKALGGESYAKLQTRVASDAGSFQREAMSHPGHLALGAVEIGLTAVSAGAYEIPKVSVEIYWNALKIIHELTSPATP